MAISLRSFFACLLLAATALMTGCNEGNSAQTGTPEEFLKYYYERVSAGDISAGLAMQNPDDIKELGEREVRDDVEQQARKLQKEGGVAEFHYTFTPTSKNRLMYQGVLVMKNGTTYKNHFGYIQKIDGKWYK